jgi:hypothetical protein
MKELEKKCEYCEYYCSNYEHKCLDCRETEGICDYSMFEIAKELIEWKESEVK